MWRFPEIKFTRKNGSGKQITHVLNEAMEVCNELSAKEFNQENIDMEMADLYHSAETYFRIRQREGVSVEEIFRGVIAKNKARGYYNAD